MVDLKGKIVTSLARTLFKIAYEIGVEPVYIAEDHGMSLTFETPGKSNRSWDSDLYAWGIMYYRGYANPIKPVLRYDPAIDERSTVDVEVDQEDEALAADGGLEDLEETDDVYVDVISSPMYNLAMQHRLGSQLVQPQQWIDRFFYAMIVVGGLLLVLVMLQLQSMGAF